MKIYRKVNGVSVEFELTADELRKAYCEQERKYDLEDVRCTTDYDYVRDSEYADIISEEEWTTEGYRRVAELYRHYMNKDETYWYTVRSAADEVMCEMANEKEAK